MSKYNVKSVFNLLDEDFEFKWDGEPYTIKAKSIELYPLFLADHAAGKIADSVLAEKKLSRNDLSRADIIAKILSHPYKIVDESVKEQKKTPVVKTEEK